MIALDAASAVTYGPLLIAIPIAVAAGLVSFVSPCCLPLVPGYLAYVSGSAGADAQTTMRRGGTDTETITSKPRASATMLGTVLFVLGFAAVFTSYGALFGAAGASLIRHQRAIAVVLGSLTIVMGLAYAGLLSKITWLSRTVRLKARPRVGLAGAPLLGVLFGVGWTPCIGPTLAAVLTLSVSSGGAGRGALLSFAYSLGLGIPFLFAAAGLSRAFRVFGFARRHSLAVMRVGGVMLVVVGLLEVTGAWALLITELQGPIANWQTPL